MAHPEWRHIRGDTICGRLNPLAVLRLLRLFRFLRMILRGNRSFGSPEGASLLHGEEVDRADEEGRPDPY